MHMQWTDVQVVRHGGQRGVDDSGIQRLHKKAKGNDPQWTVDSAR